MTVTAPIDPARTDRSTRPDSFGAARVAGIVGGHLSFYFLVWVGIGAALLTVNLVANGLWGDPDASYWDGQSAIFQYALLAGGIVVVTGYAPVIVTNGLTRRAAADGGLVAVGGLVVAAALATTLAFVVEHVVFALCDWPHVLGGTGELHIYDRPDQYGLILVELTSLYATHAVAGMVIGAGLFRFGWWLGSAFLAGGVLLAVLGEYVMASGFVGVRLADAVGLDPPPVGVGIAATLALVALGTAATRWLVRGMPVEVPSAAWWR